MLYAAIILSGFTVALLGVYGLHMDYTQKLRASGARVEVFSLKEKLLIETSRAASESATKAVALAAERDALGNLDACMQTVSSIRADAENKIAEVKGLVGDLDKKRALAEIERLAASRAQIRTIKAHEDQLSKKLVACSDRLAEKEKEKATPAVTLDSLAPASTGILE